MLRKFVMAPFVWGNGYVRNRLARRVKGQKVSIRRKLERMFEDELGCHDCALCPERDICKLKDQT